jgi:hypothetical protein
MPNTLPAWIGSDGAHIEVKGSYAATGDASVVLRVGDGNRPLTVVWGSLDGWQMGGLPRDFAEAGGGEPQTEAVWRVTIRGLRREAQRVKLETLDAGTGKWGVAVEKDAAVEGLENWLAERDGVLVFGFAGEAGLASGASVRMVRESSLFLIK